MPSKKAAVASSTVGGMTVPGRRRKRGDIEDGDENSDVERTHLGSKTSKFKHREKFDLNILLAQEEADASKQNLPCWTTVKGGPSSRPIRPYCTVCGWPSAYKCSECFKKKPFGLIRYFCGLKCQQTHKDTDCSKPMQLLNW